MMTRKPGGERGKLDANCRPEADRSQMTHTIKINPHHRVFIKCSKCSSVQSVQVFTVFNEKCSKCSGVQCKVFKCSMQSVQSVQVFNAKCSKCSKVSPHNAEQSPAITISQLSQSASSHNESINLPDQIVV